MLFEHVEVLGAADVAERNQRVAAQELRVVPGHVQAVVVADERFGLEPLDEIDVPCCGRSAVATAFLNDTVPGTDVLADAPAVDLCPEPPPILLGNRRR